MLEKILSRLDLETSKLRPWTNFFINFNFNIYEKHFRLFSFMNPRLQSSNQNLSPLQMINTQQIEISCEHIAANCNPMPNCIDFLGSEALVFCFKNQVGIYSIAKNRILMNLNHRIENSNRANCVKVLNQKDIKRDCILVGYDSGHLVLYQIRTELKAMEENKKIKPDFRILWSVKQDSSLISLHLNGEVLLSNNNSGTVIEYRINDQFLSLAKEANEKSDLTAFSETYQLKFALNKIIESITSFFYENKLIVFLGGVDQKIHTYSRGLQNVEYQYCFSLSGHQNAITKLTIVREQETKFDEFLLASASKDGYIRIWKITSNEEITKFHKNVKTLQFQDSKSNKRILKMFLESVLVSHECSVTNLHWAHFRKSLELISCSLDCTICIWEKDVDLEAGSWNVRNRMGQLLGNKNAYFEIISDPNNQYLAAVNYIGSTLIWEYNKGNDKFSLRESFTGHSNHVRGLDWNHTDSFLVTVSKDQTTRVLAQHRETCNFAQISRAQIHGYDINTVVVVKVKDNTIDVIACGADEKVIRIIQPPACFANYLNSFTLNNLHLYFDSDQEENKYIKTKANPEKNQPLLYETYSEGGVQVLGLMTKMQKVQREKITNYYDEQEDEVEDQEQKDQQTKLQGAIDFSKPPNDDYLVKHTLWPEMNKLYGHPHEISFLARNREGTLMASSCHALNKQSANVLIWDAKNNWKILKIIQYHNYTVFGMEFSGNGSYFVTVSKDRKLAAFNCEDGSFDLLFGYQCHSRAITSVSTNFDSEIIVTGSRDKTIKLHSFAGKKIIDEINMGQAIFSVSFGKGQKFRSMVACGDQNGTITILKTDPLAIVYKIPDSIGHTEPVNQIKWRGQSGEFSSCSDDHSVKIFKVWI